MLGISWISNLHRAVSFSVLLQRHCLTPIVAHHKHRGQRWISEFRKFSKSKPRPKKIFAPPPGPILIEKWGPLYLKRAPPLYTWPASCLEMELEQSGRFSFSVIFDYLKDVKYPEGFTKNDKRALRKRAAFFCIKEANLYYIGGKSSSSYR